MTIHKVSIVIKKSPKGGMSYGLIYRVRHQHFNTYIHIKEYNHENYWLPQS